MTKTIIHVNYSNKIVTFKEGEIINMIKYIALMQCFKRHQAHIKHGIYIYLISRPLLLAHISYLCSIPKSLI
jgi:hypothetical protein